MWLCLPGVAMVKDGGGLVDFGNSPVAVDTEKELMDADQMNLARLFGRGSSRAPVIQWFCRLTLTVRSSLRLGVAQTARETGDDCEMMPEINTKWYSARYLPLPALPGVSVSTRGIIAGTNGHGTMKLHLLDYIWLFPFVQAPLDSVPLPHPKWPAESLCVKC